VDALGLPDDRVLVAGDTLNDLSLFQTRFRGVAVGNAEAPLVDAIDGLPDVHHSAHPGCAGIADAIEHFGLTPSTSPFTSPFTSPSTSFPTERPATR
jgi:hydroxymethylpyrimidine pyrophosphatase-like HAD family hydrolase